VVKISDKKQQEIDEERKCQADPHYEMYIKENEQDDEIQCDVCLEYEHTDVDQMVICGLCNVAVHQSCYGGEIID